MSVIMDKLSNIIPDFREIVEIFNGMLAQHTEDTAHIEDETKTWVRDVRLSRFADCDAL